MNFKNNGTVEILLLMILNTICFVNTLVRNNDNYGPYTADFSIIEYCAGPKSRNVTHNTLHLMKVEEDYTAFINLTFMASCQVDMVKIKTFVVEQQRKTLLFNYNINGPCNHYVFATLIENYFKARKCMIEKGAYVLALNFSNITRKFYGQSAFYGEFQYKATVTCKKGNVLCWVFTTVFKKKI